MSKKIVVFCSADNVNPEVKKNDEYTQVNFLKGKRILFNAKKHLVIIGNIAIDYHQEGFGMAENLIFGVFGDSMTVNNEFYNVRTASVDDFENAVSFQMLLQNRVSAVTLHDLYSINRLEDAFLSDFHDCMLWHKNVTDEKMMAEAVVRAMGYPRWFNLFDSKDGLIETLTMFAKRFIEEKLWVD